MRICFVTRGIPTQDYPMQGIFEWDQAKALSELGHEVTYIVIDLRSLRRKRKYGYRSYIKSDIHVEEVNIPLGNIPEGMLRLVGKYALKKALKSAKKKYGSFDIIHSHFIDMAVVTSEVLGGKSVHVITEHSSRLNGSLSAKQIRKYGAVYNNADSIIAVSESLQRRLKTVFGIDSKCIHNIADTAVFDYEESERLASQYRFITVGNLTKNKHMDIVIEAFEEVKKKIAGSELIIIGDGSERKSLEELILEKNLKGYVHLKGRLNREEVSYYMKQSDCFVLASNSETFGVVYIEAIASGLPVIATKCGGPEDFVNEKNGILIPLDDKDALIDAMIKIYNKRNDFDRQLMSEEIKNNFSGNIIAKEIEQLYMDVVRNKSERKN